MPDPSPAPPPAGPHDDLGRSLDLTIRLAPDGRIYFHDLTADLLPVAAAVCPDDRSLRRRLALAQGFREADP